MDRSEYNKSIPAAQAAMVAVIDYLKEPVPTADEAHSLIDKVLSEHGCKSPEGHIVASGKKSAEPHERGFGLINPGEPIVIDIFPQDIEKQCWADISRTVCIGKAPKELKKMHQCVLDAQKIAVEMIKPGIKCNLLHKAVWDFFEDNDFKTGGVGSEFKYEFGFVHGLGHGVTTLIHDSPNISSNNSDFLEEGQIITIEPGLYYPEIGGVRIEDMYLVTASGCLELTNHSKELEI